MTFITYDSNKITQIPICNQEEENIITWMANKDGNYTIKLGYDWFHNQSLINNLGISNYNDTNEFRRSYGALRVNLE